MTNHQPMSDWAQRRLHFIAIGGAGMSGLALVCHRLRAQVSGSDRAESSYLERLRAAGLAPRRGHDADAVPSDAEVGVSTALPAHGSLDGLVAQQEVVRFDAEAPGPALGLRMPGRHNLLDARAALAAIELADLDVESAAEGLASFPGMLRRLELKGHCDGATIYDDYAHHPTEVAAALAALRELGPRRLIAVFQPHLYSRTKALAPRFGRALAAADEVGVLDVYPAPEVPE